MNSHILYQICQTNATSLTNFSASSRLTQHAVMVDDLAEQIGFQVRSQRSEVRFSSVFCLLLMS